MKIKWISIIPLIGGMSLGSKNAFKSYPEAILSYTPFKNNDQHLLDYWNYNDYFIIDENSNKLPDNLKLSEIDVVNTVCPCAGLSTLSTSESRGENSHQNEWLYKSAHLILGQVKPKVFVGENAPGLFTLTGSGVVDKLKLIGKKYGYTLSLYKTCNSQFGVPQKRMRTFYFFWKDKQTPILPWINKSYKKMSEFLDEVPQNTKYHDIQYKTELLDNEFLWNLLKSEFTNDTKKLREIIFNSWPGKNAISVYKFLFNKNINQNINKVNNYCNKIIKNSNDATKIKEAQTVLKRVASIHKKVINNKNFWDGTMKFIRDDCTSAVIFKNDFKDVHPTQDRFLTFREQMHLMKLPHDFNLGVDLESDINNKNVIAQNVIVDTAEKISEWILDYLNNKLELENTNFLTQDNTNKKVIFTTKNKNLF